MNKKAQDAGTTGSYVIDVIIAVIVVVLLAVFLIFVLPWAYNVLQLGLPPLGNGPVNVTGVEVLRYEASLDTIQYYNSNHVWTNFPASGVVNLDEKTVKYSDLENAFQKYFDYSPFESQTYPLGDSQGSYVAFKGLYGEGYKSLPADVVMDVFTNAVIGQSMYNPSQDLYITIGSKQTGYYVNNNIVKLVTTPTLDKFLGVPLFPQEVGKVVNGKIELDVPPTTSQRTMYNLVNNSQIQQISGSQNLVLSQSSQSTQNSFIGSEVLDIRNNLNFFPSNGAKDLGVWYQENYLSSGMQAELNSLRSQIIQLRDSSLKKTIMIPYTTSQGAQIVEVCMERNVNYFTVNLQAEVSSDAECN